MNKNLSIRKDWKLIESLIESNSRVLDIGCGEGGLIDQLEKNIQAKTSGIEINSELRARISALSPKPQPATDRNEETVSSNY